jgi:hypothetical protein
MRGVDRGLDGPELPSDVVPGAHPQDVGMSGSTAAHGDGHA